MVVVDVEGLLVQELAPPRQRDVAQRGGHVLAMNLSDRVGGLTQQAPGEQDLGAHPVARHRHAQQVAHYKPFAGS